MAMSGSCTVHSPDHGCFHGSLLGWRMTRSALSFTEQVVSMSITAVTPPTATPQSSGPIRRGLATALRDIGAGFYEATDNAAVQVDKAYIHPIEGFYELGSIVNKKTQNHPKVNKYATMAANGLGFISAFHSMIIGGILRTPGQVIKDATHSIADQMDGKKTFNGDFGAGLKPGAINQVIERYGQAASGSAPSFPKPGPGPFPVVKTVPAVTQPAPLR